MTRALHHDHDPDVTRHEVPALRRAPLDERLPRLRCAPEPVAWQPLASAKIEAEKTVIGEIPVLSLDGATDEVPENRVTAQPTAHRIPPDRWILLAIAIATLGYSLHSMLSSKAIGDLPQRPTVIARPTASVPVASTMPRYSMRTVEPSTLSRLPLELTALETAAAQAWLAGHTEEAAQLYEQLATLAPEVTSFSAAATILRSKLIAATPEVKP
jgi:hypothetical protein